MVVRWGVVGCGDIVRKRAGRALQAIGGSQLVAAHRRDPGKLRKFCDDYLVPKAYSNYDDMLADPEIDAVYIATPVSCHLEQTVAAAKAGKHVLVEKPMALNVAECDQMIAACRQAGVRLGVAYYRRCYPVILRLEELLRDGALGTPLAIHATTAIPLMPPGEEGYWRVDPALSGGGPLMDIGSHRLNLFAHFMGQPTSVRACVGTIAGAFATEDAASLVMKFPSGAHGSLQCFFGTSADLDEFSLIGTHATAHIDPLNGGELVLTEQGKTRVESLPPDPNLHAPLIADFVAAVSENRDPIVTGEEGRATQAIIEMAYRDAT